MGKKTNITLIGMPASGKSSVGVVLAKRLGKKFVDTDIVIQEKYGKGYFRIDFLDNQQIQIVDVDATSGEILGSESKAPKHLRVPAENTELKVSLAQAIEIAENKTHAKVAEADFKGKADKSFYLIETANDGQTFVMAIDAQSGKTIDAPMPPHGMAGMSHDKGEHAHFGEHSRKGKHSNQDGHSRKGEHHAL